MAILDDINCGLQRCLRPRKTKSATSPAGHETYHCRAGGLFRGELLENLLGEPLHESLQVGKSLGVDREGPAAIERCETWRAIRSQS